MKKLLILSYVLISINLYAQIPEDLPVFFDGSSDRKLEQWEENLRPQILNAFNDEVYGDIPDGFIPNISFSELEKESEVFNGLAERNQVIVKIESQNGKSIELGLLIYLPENRQGAVPVFLGLNFYGNHTIHSDKKIMLPSSWSMNNKDFGITENKAVESSRGKRTNRWPVEYILSRGYALATVYYGDIDPDFDDSYMNGLHGLLYNEESKRDSQSDAGSIAAWAYGLSRIMDYFETDEDIDNKQVVLFGHSRLGKASLWAGASDQRFSLVISNNSGCGGAALSMRKHGETVKKINDSFPHWFCGNFKKYNENEASLPVDQHMLLALMAPRPLYVASAQDDDWADPFGEQLSAFLATEIYDLYKLKTFIKKEPATINVSVKKGFVGYHIRSGKHDVKAYDWQQFLDFADYHFKKK